MPLTTDGNAAVDLRKFTDEIMIQLKTLRKKLPDVYEQRHWDWDKAVFPDHHQEGPSLVMRPSVVAVLASINEQVAIARQRKNGELICQANL